MTERPILFNGPMVRAVLDGRKSQARRVVKWNNHAGVNLAFSRLEAEHMFNVMWGLYSRDGEARWQERANAKCPYGKSGDLLWVRETFGFDCMAGADECAHKDCIHYRADVTDGRATESWKGHWKPATHMPRWASRITLEITEIRVQRLQEISEADAVAEGTRIDHMPIDVSRMPYPTHIDCGRFAAAWESINGSGSWDANPWVWAVSFKLLADSSQSGRAA
ncbi:MAG: hypothetical protein M3O02_00915 [Acidobacteriota bacterium]|nr:hypothetical protein [Acidobacteriota bacterium]